MAARQVVGPNDSRKETANTMTRKIAWNRFGGAAVGPLLLGATLLYVLLVLLPFYGNGIHLRSYGEIFGSHVDVKFLPPFAWFGPLTPWTALTQTAAILTWLFGPPVSALCALALAVRLGAGWRGVSWREKLTWPALIATALLIYTLSWPARELILTWLVD
jgi:hypothetical protein